MKLRLRLQLQKVANVMHCNLKARCHPVDLLVSTLISNDMS